MCDGGWPLPESNHWVDVKDKTWKFLYIRDGDAHISYMSHWLSVTRLKVHQEVGAVLETRNPKSWLEGWLGDHQSSSSLWSHPHIGQKTRLGPALLDSILAYSLVSCASPKFTLRRHHDKCHSTTPPLLFTSALEIRAHCSTILDSRMSRTASYCDPNLPWNWRSESIEIYDHGLALPDQWIATVVYMYSRHRIVTVSCL